MYKKISTTILLVLLFSTTFLWAQAPSGINYQAVIRNGSGVLVTSQLVSMQFSFNEGTATGTTVYKESHTVTTNAFGVANLILGQGSIVSGTFAAVDWSANIYFLGVEVNTGSGLVSIGTSQLVSVPYALEAKHAMNANIANSATTADNATTATTATTSLDNHWTKTGNNIFSNNSANVGIGTNAPSSKLDIRDGGGGYLRLFGNASGDIGGMAISPHMASGDFTVFRGVPGTGTPLFKILFSGNTGIGTVAPMTKLDINGNLHVNGTIQKGGTALGSSNTGDLGLYSRNSGQWMRFSTNAADIRFFTTDADGVDASGPNAKMVLSAAGNLGIGTQSPTYRLHLEGNSRFSGGYSEFCTSTNNSQGNVGMGSGGSSNVKLMVKSTQDFGIYIDATSSPQAALYVLGKGGVTGNFSKGGGSFKIDHPLDPSNKFLYHSFVESPDMMNIYNGNVTTDANGTAIITMPAYFEALNQDFRYQITPIGVFAQAMVSKELAGNTFEIKTDKPNVKVSWMVTGIRHDAFANQNRIPGEVEKTGVEKGKYIHPEAFGLPDNMRIDYLKTPETKAAQSTIDK